MSGFKINHQLSINNMIVEILEAMNMLEDPNGASVNDIVFVLDSLYGKVHLKVVLYALKSAVSRGILEFRNNRYFTWKENRNPDAISILNNRSCPGIRTSGSFRTIKSTRSTLCRNSVHKYQQLLRRRATNRRKRVKRKMMACKKHENLNLRELSGETEMQVESSEDSMGKNNDIPSILVEQSIMGQNDGAEAPAAAVERTFNDLGSEDVAASKNSRESKSLPRESNTNVTSQQSNAKEVKNGPDSRVGNHSCANNQKSHSKSNIKLMNVEENKKDKASVEDYKSATQSETKMCEENVTSKNVPLESGNNLANQGTSVKEDRNLNPRVSNHSCVNNKRPHSKSSRKSINVENKKDKASVGDYKRVTRSETKTFINSEGDRDASKKHLGQHKYSI